MSVHISLRKTSVIVEMYQLSSRVFIYAFDLKISFFSKSSLFLVLF